MACAITGKKKGLNQKLGTPPELFNAACRRFGGFQVDLAADERNALCAFFIDEEMDSLSLCWGDVMEVGGPPGWLNPPFERIDRWPAKCFKEATESGVESVLLVPAATDTEWFRKSVIGKCQIINLNGRVTFIDYETREPVKCQKRCDCGGVVNAKNGKREKCERLECGEWSPSPYPKPCMLCRYGPEVIPSIGWWDWKKLGGEYCDFMIAGKHHVSGKGGVYSSFAYPTIEQQEKFVVQQGVHYFDRSRPGDVEF